MVESRNTSNAIQSIDDFFYVSKISLSIAKEKEMAVGRCGGFYFLLKPLCQCLVFLCEKKKVGRSYMGK